MSITMYQGTAKEFKKYDSSFIGTGDNTQYKVKGHHFTPSKNVAEFYAERILTNSDTFVNTVNLNGRYMDSEETVEWSCMEDIIDNWYGDDTFDALVEDIDEKTEYTCSDDDIKRLATALLTSNEGDVFVCDLLEETEYEGWDDFYNERKSNIPPLLIIPVDSDQYIDVGIGLYENTLMRFDDNYEKVHAFLSNKMELDGLFYTNFGNTGEVVQNISIWNEDTIYIKDSELAFSPHPSSTMRM